MWHLRLILGGVFVHRAVFKKILCNDEKEKQEKGIQRVQTYLKNLYTEISLPHSKRWKDEITDITEAVSKMMQKILIEAYSEKNLTKEDIQERLFLVGRMKEGTNVGEPNEFDFSFIIPGDVETTKFRPYKVDEKLVFSSFIVNPTAKTLYEIDENGNLKATEDGIGNKTSFLDEFANRINNTCKTLTKNNDAVIEINNSKLTIHEENDTNIIIQQGVAYRFEERLRWTKEGSKYPLKISVDLVPVIKPLQKETVLFIGREVELSLVPFKPYVQDSYFYKTRLEVILKPIYALMFSIFDHKNMVLDEKQKLLENHFVRTFAKDESDLVKGMNENHWFICYVLLKYLTQYDKYYNTLTIRPFTGGYMTIKGTYRQTRFSSYNWKTMILRKVYVDEEKPDSIWECFSSITEPLQRSYAINIPYLGDLGIEEVIYLTDDEDESNQIQTVRIIEKFIALLEDMTYEQFKEKVLEVLRAQNEKLEKSYKLLWLMIVFDNFQ